MKSRGFIAALACALAATTVEAQQVPLPKTAADVPGPAAGNTLTKEYVQTIGRMAYVWGYAMVNSHNRRAAFVYVTSQNGNVPGWNGGVLPMAPVGQLAMLNDYIKPEQTFVACPNQDVAYGAGFSALDKEPTVLQVPTFGDRFWVYALYDARTDEFAEIGKPYGTKPGFYMIVGPNWKGAAPAGITAVVRSSTELVFTVPRVFKDDNAKDTKAVQPVLNQIVSYPLSQFDGKMKTIDWSKVPHFPAPPGPGGETKWVVPEKFYDQLPGVMKLVPPLPGEEALYAWINSVFEAAAKDHRSRSSRRAGNGASTRRRPPRSSWPGGSEETSSTRSPSDAALSRPSGSMPPRLATAAPWFSMRRRSSARRASRTGSTGKTRTAARAA